MLLELQSANDLDGWTIMEDIIPFSNGSYDKASFEDLSLIGETLKGRDFEECLFRNCSLINCVLVCRPACTFIYDMPLTPSLREATIYYYAARLLLS